ncbi:MAG TPA: hypothetical protein VNG53_08530 [Bacteroidia bacterium]|nr:hypothetical protein [Bacteroidia bacterium]
MKARLFTGWTITRALYLFIGIVFIIQSVISNEWLGILIGTYFAAMGLFAFGCAAGNCFVPNAKQKPTSELDEIKSE